MSRDELEQLLRVADDASGCGPVTAGDLAVRVRQVAGRRRKVRVASVAVGMALVGIVGFHMVGHREVAKRTEMVVIKEYPAAELAAVRREIAARERLVAVLLMEEKVGRAEGALAMERSMPGDRGSAERAAAAVVWQAQRAGRAGLAKEAAASYADVVKFFPDTVSAEQARRQLGSNRKDG